jgi:phospholipase C
MYRAHAPILFPIVFGLIGVLLIFGTFSVWFKSIRITIDSTTVRATNRWLVFSRTRQFSTNDVARFAAKTGMQSGTQIFTDIKLIPRGSDEKFASNTERLPQTFQDTFQDASLPEVEKVMARFREAAGPSGVTVAGSIASVTEANWLVQEMNKALGRK